MEESLGQTRDAAIKRFYHELNKQQLDQKNQETAAKLTLYYAQGATEKAVSQLSKDQAAAATNQQQLQVAMDSLGLSKSLIDTAKVAAKDADKTHKLATVVAADVESATQDLTQLAADIAAAYAVASSKDLGSEINELVHICLGLTKKAAQDAETASVLAMDTTIEAAQSKAPLVLEQAGVLTEDIDRLAKQLSLDHNKLQKIIEQRNEAVGAALLQENQEDGRFQLAKQEEEALTYSQGFANQHLNYNLQFLKKGSAGECFILSFAAFAETTTVPTNGHPTTIKIAKEYRIFIVAEEDAPGFSVSDVKHSTHSFAIEPKQKLHYQQEFVIADLIANGSSEDLEEKDPDSRPPIATDFKGIAVERGKPYVFFVHLTYTLDHQNAIDDIEGKLSLASPPFKLRTDLPTAQDIILQFYRTKTDLLSQCSMANAVRVSFTLPRAALHFGQEDLTQLMDFRVLLFKKNDELAFKLNHLTEHELATLRGLHDEDRQIRKDYLQAQQNYDTAIANHSKEQDLYRLKLEQAKLVYQVLQRGTEVEAERIKLLNELKISSFYLDPDILLQIPQAYALKVKVNNQLLFELRDQIKAYKTDQEALMHRAEEIARELEKLRTEEKKDEQGLEKAEAELDKLEAKYQHLKAMQAAALEQVPEKVKEIDTDFHKLIRILNEKGKHHEVIRLLEEIKRDETFIAEIQERAAELLKLQKEIASMKKKILDFKQALQSTKEKEQYETEQEIEVIKKLEELEIQIQLLQDEIHELEKGDKGVEEEESTAKPVEGASDLVRFVAVNEQGDFTDNYGEPLQTGEAYVALVLSRIKDDQLGQQARFKSSFSSFSEPKIYHL